MPVEVRAHRDEHQRLPARVRGGRDQRVDERGVLRFVAAGREELLELVDCDDRAAREPVGRSVQGVERVRAGAQQSDVPPLRPGQHARSPAMRAVSLQGRGLAAARGPDDREERGVGEARDHLGHEPLAPEEDAGVVDVERRQALERTGDDRGCAGVHGLQFLDVARDLVLDSLEIGPTARRALGRGAQPPGGLGARPFARGAVDALRHAAALEGQSLDRYVVRTGAGVERGDGAHAVGVERSEAQRSVGARVTMRRGSHQHRRTPRQIIRQRAVHLLAGAIEIVEHQQRRAPRRAQAVERGPRRLRWACAGGVEHERPVPVRLDGELGGQAGLADAARSGEKDDRAPTRSGVAP